MNRNTIDTEKLLCGHPTFRIPVALASIATYRSGSCKSIRISAQERTVSPAHPSSTSTPQPTRTVFQKPSPAIYTTSTPSEGTSAYASPSIEAMSPRSLPSSTICTKSSRPLQFSTPRSKSSKAVYLQLQHKARLLFATPTSQNVRNPCKSSVGNPESLEAFHIAQRLVGKHDSIYRPVPLLNRGSMP